MIARQALDIFKAIEIISQYTKPAFKEFVTLKDAMGRYSAESIYSPFDYPTWRRSRMDGYACNANVSDFSKPFKVCGDISAADTFSNTLNANECIRIATGAKVPDCVDMVVKVEDSNEVSDEEVFLNKYDDEITNIDPIGADIKAGELIVCSECKVDHRHIEKLATLRVNSIYVKGLPRVGILSTGSEITEQFASGSRVVNSNYYALSSLLSVFKIPHSSLGICEDEKEQLKQTIMSGVDNFDVFISCGGTALSRYDLMDTVIRELGGTILIDGLCSSPGKTFRFGLVKNKPFFILPGTPEAAMMCAELFLISWIRSNFDKEFVLVKTKINFDVRKRKGFYRLESCLTTIVNGEFQSYKRQSEQMSTNTFKSIVIIPPDVENAVKGNYYDTYLLYYA